MIKFIAGLFILGNCLQSFSVFAQTAEQSQISSNESDLFDTNEVLEITLQGNIKQVLNDRSVNSTYHPLQLLYKKTIDQEVEIPVEVKTRGHFRRLKTNCIYPPLQINFSKSDVLKNSAFAGLDKLKLVMPCKGDQYVIREWLVYKLYNLVTPNSFKTRLVKVKLKDSLNKKIIEPFYGLLLEPEKQMAKRNGQVAVERKLQPEETNEEAFLTMCVFEYLIGNTDWSIQYQQNIKLIAADSNALIPIPVPYDFDHSGLVNAPYANPTEKLELSSVRERRYRGYCIKDMKVFDGAVALFNGLKKDIYSTYTDCKLLDEKYVRSTLKYLDEFYYTINKGSALKKDFSYPCDNNGTGNVIIKGMKKD